MSWARCCRAWRAPAPPRRWSPRSSRSSSSSIWSTRPRWRRCRHDAAPEGGQPVRTLTRWLPGHERSYISLSAAAEAGLTELAHAPITARELVENVLRQAHRAVGDPAADAVPAALDLGRGIIEAAAGATPTAFDFFPVRLLLQDHSGVPVLADLASLRSLLAERGLDPHTVSPALPVDLVVDHSVEVHESGTPLE